MWIKCPHYILFLETVRNGHFKYIFSLLNNAGINGYVIYQYNNPTAKAKRRPFLKQFDLALIQPHSLKRSQNPRVSCNIKAKLKRNFKNGDASTEAPQNKIKSLPNVVYVLVEKIESVRNNVSNVKPFYV